MMLRIIDPNAASERHGRKFNEKNKESNLQKYESPRKQNPKTKPNQRQREITMRPGRNEESDETDQRLVTENEELKY